MFWTSENRRRKNRPCQSWKSSVTTDLKEVGLTWENLSEVYDGESVLPSVLLLHVEAPRSAVCYSSKISQRTSSSTAVVFFVPPRHQRQSTDTIVPLSYH